MTDVELFVRGSGAAGPADRRRWVGPLLAVLTLVLLGALTLQPVDTGRPFDPESAGPLGLAATLDVVRSLDVRVTLTSDLDRAAEADTVLVPPLGWDRQTVRSLAARGPRVVADVTPSDEDIPSPLGVSGIGLVDLEPECDLLADVRSLRTSQWPGLQPDTAVDLREQCIVREGAAWLNRVATGEGELVSLTTMAPLVNERLVDSDAAVAAVRLLAPTGAEDVVVLLPPPGEPPPTLFELIDDRWFDAAWLTLAVLVALAMARGRRLGRPVDEQLPVRVPSGELARAVGDLRARAGHEQRSAEALRAMTLRDARRRLGLAPTADAGAVVAALEARGTPLPAAVAAALTEARVATSDELVAAARALAEARAIIHRRPDRETP